MELFHLCPKLLNSQSMFWKYQTFLDLFTFSSSAPCPKSFGASPKWNWFFKTLICNSEVLDISLNGKPIMKWFFSLIGKLEMEKISFPNVIFFCCLIWEIFKNCLTFHIVAYSIFCHFKFCYYRKNPFWPWCTDKMTVWFPKLYTIIDSRQYKTSKHLLKLATFAVCFQLFFFLAKLSRQTQRFYFTLFYLKAKLHVTQHLSTCLARKWDESLGKRYLSMEAQIKVNKLFKLPNKTN